MKMLFTAIRGLIYGSLFILTWWWVGNWVRRYDAGIGVILPLWTEAIGIIFLIFGFILMFSCIGVFILIGKGTPAPLDPPREFVAVGPYRFVRNPMYIGGWITYAGFGLYVQSISIILLAFCWLVLIHFLVIFYEEPVLKKRFGNSYIEYTNSVKRWIPRLNR